MKGQGDPWGYTEPSMKRLQRRMFRLNDRIATLEEEIRLTEAELGYHRHINDDAQRDATVGNHIDREEADLTSADVRRFETTIDRLQDRKRKLIRKRDLLLVRIGD